MMMSAATLEPMVSLEIRIWPTFSLPRKIANRCPGVGTRAIPNSRMTYRSWALTKATLPLVGAAGATPGFGVEARRTPSVNPSRSVGEVLVVLHPRVNAADRKMSQAVRTRPFKGRDSDSSTCKTNAGKKPKSSKDKAQSSREVPRLIQVQATGRQDDGERGAARCPGNWRFP